MTNPSPTHTPSELGRGTWRLDPGHSSVEFHVPQFWGLITVKGRFDEYQGKLDLTAAPAIELTIDAGSLDTKNARRDKHLRSADFFDVEHHPQVRFVSDSAALDRDELRVRGQLHAAGRQVPLELNATVTIADGHPQIHAEARVDQRQLGMTWSPLGMVRSPSKLIVGGRLVQDG
jgi:polyisoprenoid-binding protein YceI